MVEEDLAMEHLLWLTMATSSFMALSRVAVKVDFGGFFTVQQVIRGFNACNDYGWSILDSQIT
jgi:hypothetical protein